MDKKNLEHSFNQLNINGKIEYEETKCRLETIQNLKVEDLAHQDNTKITYLNLSNCGLSTLPDALKYLPLRHLNLSRNKLCEVPQCLYYGLEKLETLDLANNGITTFNSEPNCCERLQLLLLSSNKFQNIPEWILCLRAVNLKELHYDFNKVTCMRCIFDNSMNFPVQKLSLKNCLLRELDMIFLKECKNLEELDISNSRKINLHMNVIHNIERLFVEPIWKNIYILRLDNLSISVFPEGLTWLETLTELYLSNNYFMWLPTNGLEYLVNLEILDLSHNIISSIPNKITWLEHVRILNFSFNNIEIIPDFSTMKSLEVLDLYYNNLVEFNCDMSSTSFKYLDLEYNQFDTENCSLNSYREMRNNLRKSILEERFIGFRLVNDFDNESHSGTTTDDEVDIGDNKDSFVSTITEDWDEEIRLNERHQDISQSDDEWQGFEEDVIPTITGGSYHFDKGYVLNEAVIFCDAD